MRALLAIPLLFIVQTLASEHRFISPNGEFQAYTTVANEDGTGMKLYLRRANSREPGVLLRQNNRWIDANWSPNSQFLAVIDHLDGAIFRTFTSLQSRLLTQLRHSSITRQTCADTM